MKNKPAPLLNPGTLKPMTARELDGVFCDEPVQQELDDTTACILSQLYHDGLMEATGVEQTASLRRQSTELDGHSANSKPAALQGNRAAGCFYYAIQENGGEDSVFMLPGDGSAENYSPRTAAKPASRSAMMSSMCSVPMDRRMVFW